MIEPYLPVDVVFHPNWWHKNYDLSFDRDFFYDPERRVWQEQRMRQLPPLGFHHCGDNAHLFAPLYARAGAIYLDVGWGSDIAACRAALPDAWLSLRLNPVKMLTATTEEAAADTESLLQAHGPPWDKVAVCCINMDYGTPDEAIRAVFHTVARYRAERDSGLQKAYREG